MTSQSISPISIGQVLEITFPTFTPRITILSERKLTVEIITGDPFTDTVDYEAVPIRDGLVMLSPGKNTSGARSCTCSISPLLGRTPR